ncbi:hypothetical protein PCANC_09354 [Puccinia coronata f. sp. avenae]|uniref:F-box domain-containing protein n=1 Tax=Puccinia coronata f. sp. avenae TaxID=200324 RepID=A0A2N5URU8_9BASI|nr:hypothetical protein PCANC_09354 [Puccinia coronata f. sp. avenae]PLW47314.1 hypothetical protein PCASD_02562 [Puccinia coronata f. sp. avenae]
MIPFQHPQKSKDADCQINGHISLLDLPVEIVLDIIAWLPRSGKERRRKSKPHSIIQSFKALRLTSKSLAGVLTPVLLNAVNISCSSSARDFLEWCKQYTSQNRDPPVRRLTITNVGHPSLSNKLQAIPYEVFEDILSAISPSLHQLKIVFDDCFEFSPKIAHSFQRAQKLWALHLQILSKPPHLNMPPPASTPNPPGGLQLHDPCRFLACLKALPSLSELNLNNCLDYCRPLTMNDELTSLPPVQHMSVSIESHSTSLPSEPHKFLLELCRAMSDSLLILQIRGSRYDSSKLLPVLAATRSRLEALHLGDAGLVQNFRQWRFPRLRTFLLDDSRYLTREEFNSPFFHQITTLVLRRWNGTDVPLDIPVETFASLKRVILTYTSRVSLDTITLSKACQDACIDLLASTKSVDLREIWTVDAVEAQMEEIS